MIVTDRETEVEDVGEIPYQVIRPVLVKIENPKQLVSTP